MKKALLLILLFAFHFSFYSRAQSWIWARETVSKDPNAFGDLWGDHNMAVDNAGNAYMTGFFEDSIRFGGTVTLHAVQNGWNDCVFLSKYNNAGNFMWAKQTTSSPNSHAYGSSVVTDRAGNVYITGWFTDTISFGSTMLLADMLNASMFLAKYSSAGNLVWAKKYGNNASYVNCYSLAIDEAGKLYVTGFFNGTFQLGSQTLHSHSDDVFIAKFDSSGSLVWAKQALDDSKNINYSYGLSIATGPQCSIYITGLFKDTVSFGSFMLYSPNYSNTLLVKYDSSGNVAWASQSQHNSHSSGNSVMVDGQGNPYITGNFIDTVYFDNIPLISSPKYAIFLVKYSPFGKVIWANQDYNLSSSGWNRSTLGTDTLPAGGGYIAFSGNMGPQYTTAFLGDTLYFTSNHESAIVFAQFDSAGDFLCGTIFSEGREDDCEAIAVSPSGRCVYLGGDIFDTTVMGPDTLSCGNDMPFVARWDGCPGVFTTIFNTNDISCNGLCDGQATANSYDGVPPYTYRWSDDSTTSTINNLCPGTYWVIVTDSAGHKDSTTFVITQPDVFIDTACCNAKITNGESVPLYLSDNSAGNTYSWSPSAGLSCDNCPYPVASPSVSTVYTVTITNDNGCSFTDSVIIDVLPDCQIFVPDAFSPNGDGQNDVLFVRGSCIKAIDFLIFDRWGNKVFESESQDMGWDGTYRGQPMNTGTYMYTLTVLKYNDEREAKKGSITLVR